jgi:membrane protein implicated in regulation of membrane protease activity
MKKSAIIALGIFVVWVGISILQLWNEMLDLDTYWKLTLTLGLVLVAVVAGGLIYREYIEESDMRKEGYID